MIEVSAVVPVFGCKGCLEELHARLVKALETITSDYEILFVDDRSLDDAWPLLKDLARSDPNVRSIRLSRNFGQHAAITAGLAASQARWTVVMDCDLQDQPEEIPKLYARAKEGFDLVLARRQQRTHSFVRVALARGYFKLLNAFMGTNIDAEYGTFSILNRKVVDAYLSMGDRDRHFLFVLNWLGFNRGTIRVEQAPRSAGKSSYSLRRLVQHALNGVFFQTANLLVYIVYLGFVIAAVGLLWAAYIVYLYLTAHPPAGYASVMVMLLVLGGFIITSTGVTGLYIGRVFQQVKGRPLFVVDEVAQQLDQRRNSWEKAARSQIEAVQ